MYTCTDVQNLHPHEYDIIEDQNNQSTKSLSHIQYIIWDGLRKKKPDFLNTLLKKNHFHNGTEFSPISS